MNIIDPLTDSRWDGLVQSHPQATIFHQRGWLQALARTYGYQPFAITNAAPDSPLTDALALCRISSWLTGTRFVSLPFSDHCQPLIESGGSRRFVQWLHSECDAGRAGYVELRPLTDEDVASTLREPASFYFHELDLSPSLETIFSRFHKDCIQRGIRRAERERLSYEAGSTPRLLDEFYRLQLMTRRRHHLLPQPRAWFHNLAAYLGERLEIRVARKEGTPVAAILSLRCGSTVTYKYGCSNARFHKLGGMPLLFWRLVSESKAWGAVKVDMGRSDVQNHGLIVFKDRIGAEGRLLHYHRYPRTSRKDTIATRQLGRFRKLFSVLPDMVSSTAGRIVYKHVG